MKRLHELTKREIDCWREERQKAGNEKYGDAHLQRYGLVDIMEELLDAENIAGKLIDRCGKAGINISENEYLEHLFTQIALARRSLQKLDWLLPDTVCTDEKGGYRPGWSGNIHDQKETEMEAI